MKKTSWVTPDPDFYIDYFRNLAAFHKDDGLWVHRSGYEFLVTNPMKSLSFESLHRVLAKKVWDPPRRGMFTWRYQKPGDKQPEEYDHPQFQGNPATDHFTKLPPELINMILDILNSEDIFNLRLSSRCFRQLPKILIRTFTLEKMPWMWELRDQRAGSGQWQYYRIFCGYYWEGKKVFKNRRRIWWCAEEIVETMQRNLVIKTE